MQSLRSRRYISSRTIHVLYKNTSIIVANNRCIGCKQWYRGVCRTHTSFWRPRRRPPAPRHRRTRAPAAWGTATTTTSRARPSSRSRHYDARARISRRGFRPRTCGIRHSFPAQSEWLRAGVRARPPPRTRARAAVCDAARTQRSATPYRLGLTSDGRPARDAIGGTGSR